MMATAGRSIMRVGIATYDTSPSQCWERLLWCETHNFLFGSAQSVVAHGVCGLLRPVVWFVALRCAILLESSFHRELLPSNNLPDQSRSLSRSGNKIKRPSGVRPVGGQLSPGGGR